ncbi:MAG TPA: pyridoxal-dependent decarboxylase [Gammaproteobacteria bacterium]|nr:pyridoxal-dependent decarboxylase [Gammaproteobacteria bacterium]
MSPRKTPRRSSTRQDADLAFANPCFLGSSGENSETFERVLLEFLRDHVYWRRNFHPEDPPPIPMFAAHDPAYVEFMDRMRTELNTLTAALKRSVPFFNPRYLGHMVSDTLLPGLLAQLITTLYNPNNVSPEAAPVTLRLELEVGLQLARMLGFGTDPASTPCAWGHLTSGGTLANYEGLAYMRSLRCYPLALRDALHAAHHLPALKLDDGRRLAELDDWTLFNLPLPQVLALPAKLAVAVQGLEPAEQREFRMAIDTARIEHLGPVAFAARHPLWAQVRILAPVTVHYSWHKAMRVLGFGSSQLECLPVDAHMRLAVPAFKARLDDCVKQKIPVLSTVAVLGTTEFGSIDPIHIVAELRQKFCSRGLEFALHVDAAWGGYLSSIFREPDGSFAPHKTVRGGFSYFPSATVHASFEAVREADVVTVDPHKLGYLPFGIGGIVWRDRRVLQFLSEHAAYVFDDQTETEGTLGQYILEGSKPGAPAAAAWVTHRVLPPDRKNLGRLQHQTIRATEYFFDRLPQLAARLKGKARLLVPFEPDTNLLCLAINPEGNRSLAAMNRFGRCLYSHLGIATGPVQMQDFFSSHTAVERRMIAPRELTRVLKALGIDAASFVDTVDKPELQSDNLFLLRHTLMNPWLLERVEGRNYLDRYCDYLEELVLLELDAETWCAAGSDTPLSAASRNR